MMRGMFTGNELENINIIKAFCLGASLEDRDARDVMFELCGDTEEDLEALEALEELQIKLSI